MSIQGAKRSELSRREFLGGLVLTGGATAIAPLGVTVPESLRAVGAKQVMPDYAIGILYERHPDYIVLHAAGYIPELVRLDLTSKTLMYKRGFGVPASTLQLGDRIHAGTHLTRAGARIAEWVQANPVTGWGTVVRVGPSQVTLRPMREMSRIGRELIIEPYTRVFAQNGRLQLVGTALGLHPEENVIYTGVGIDTNPLVHQAWAYTIYHTSTGYS